MPKLDALHIVQEPRNATIGGAAIVGQMLQEATKSNINWSGRNLQVTSARVRVLYAPQDPWSCLKTPRIAHVVNEIAPRNIQHTFGSYSKQDTIVTVAEHTWQLLKPLFPHVELIENVARPWFTPGSKDPELARDKPVLVYCGQLSASKGTRTLVQAVADLNCELWLLGSGMPTRKQPNVKALGFKREAELLRYLRSADAFVFPSLSEGMPLALLEAMAIGLPCIVTDIPGNKDTCKDAALYVDTTVASLRAGIGTLLASKQLQADLSGASLEVAATRKFDVWGDRFTSLLETACKL